MGKSSKPYATGAVTVNGQQKSNVSMNGNTVNANYNMSDAEKRAYDYAQNSFADSVPNINVFSGDTVKNMQNQLNAYTQSGIKTLNNIYEPMIDNLKTDIASRFGNFDNSSFFDNLNSIESNRADAMSSLAQDIMTKQNDLYNDELSRRYNYMNFLNGIQNQANTNAMNYIKQAFAQSKDGNNFNLQNQRDDYVGLNTYANLLTPFASTLIKSFTGGNSSDKSSSNGSSGNGMQFDGEMLSAIIKLLPMIIG